MNCNDATRQLDDWVDGQLDPAAAEAVQAHLAGCPACHAAGEELRQLLNLLGTLPPVPAPADFMARLDQRLSMARPAGPGGLRMLARPLLAASLLGVTVLGGLWVARGPAPVAVPRISKLTPPAQPTPAADPPSKDLGPFEKRQQRAAVGGLAGEARQPAARPAQPQPRVQLATATDPQKLNKAKDGSAGPVTVEVRHPGRVASLLLAELNRRGLASRLDQRALHAKLPQQMLYFTGLTPEEAAGIRQLMAHLAVADRAEGVELGKSLTLSSKLEKQRLSAAWGNDDRASSGRGNNSAAPGAVQLEVVIRQRD